MDIDALALVALEMARKLTPFEHDQLNKSYRRFQCKRLLGHVACKFVDTRQQYESMTKLYKDMLGEPITFRAEPDL